ncbi:MAG TPA: undecaprenyl-diphosphate phosphatase, partial [Leptospiraceae bacterium]|nr:undecaprenyl-diphosphate phosphatase [Leptospiraceae bacterium]
MIQVTEAAILGIIQGLTEFIPISSTAHLRIIPAMLGMGDPGAAYTAVIQLGTLFSLIIYFWRDLLNFAQSSLQGLASGSPFRD